MRGCSSIARHATWPSNRRLEGRQATLWLDGRRMSATESEAEIDRGREPCVLTDRRPYLVSFLPSALGAISR